MKGDYGLNLLHGWNRSDILALIGVILAAVAIIISLVPPLRHMAQGWWRGVMLRAGFPRRKYAKWFITKRWGVYENPYLDDVENLDLRNTYVPLSFRIEGAPDQLTLATDLLSDANIGNLIIDGGPGSGKSTLLKAYGVAVLHERSLLQGALSRGRQPVPFLVQLRKLARSLDGGKGVRDYLISEILVADVGMSTEQARHFLEYSIRHRQVVVMFDGLDEVTADQYQAVLEAVFRFKDDNNPDCPTSRARLLLTCRRQNFLSVRDDWVPAFHGRECSLAPLRNSEIFSYLDKLRRNFRPPNSPESFMQAVRASGTLELHRTPLIMAMSVGLYARKQYYEIPSSIAKLYETMIREMLDRHSFRRDPGGKALRFQADDKYRFLPEFSLHAAQRSGQFGDFTRSELIEFARHLAPQLDAVRDPEGMVEEITNRAGLLNDVGEKGVYVFAHRSIQEYLAAEELRARSDGDDILLGKATDPEWRQVAQFYSAGQGQRQIDHYLSELSKRNPGLAAYCLAGAKPSDQVAKAVLDAVEPIDDMNLPALAAATISPRVPVQEMAVARLRMALTTPGSTLTTANTDVDGLLPLLSSLAGTNAADIVALVPQIIASVPDDPRLVEPLWRCLATPGLETLPECRVIVQRLLDLAMDPNSMEELARQDHYDREFLTEEARRKAYPFKTALHSKHNLVTLLAWALNLDVSVANPNRYLQARAARRLDRIEADRRRTISFRFCVPTRIVSGLDLAVAFSVAIAILCISPARLIHTFGWWTLLAALLGIGIYLLAELAIDLLPERSRVRYYLAVNEETTKSGNSYFAYLNSRLATWMTGIMGFGIIPLSFAISPLSLFTRPTAGYFAFAACAQLAFWLTDINAFGSDRRYYVYRPNIYVDVYDDPRSRHWLGVKTTETTVPAGQ